MNQIDYELGLATAEEGELYHTDEDFNSADGLGKAKIGLIACNTKCNARHPFNRTKRDQCKGQCDAAYNAKIAYIDSQGGSVSDAEEAASALRLVITKKEEQDVLDARNDLGGGSNESGKSNQNDKNGLSTGAMVGIGFGVLAIGVVVVLVLRKRK